MVSSGEEDRIHRHRKDSLHLATCRQSSASEHPSGGRSSHCVSRAPRTPPSPPSRSRPVRPQRPWPAGRSGFPPARPWRSSARSFRAPSHGRAPRAYAGAPWAEESSASRAGQCSVPPTRNSCPTWPWEPESASSPVRRPAWFSSPLRSASAGGTWRWSACSVARSERHPWARRSASSEVPRSASRPGVCFDSFEHSGSHWGRCRGYGPRRNCRVAGARHRRAGRRFPAVQRGAAPDGELLMRDGSLHRVLSAALVSGAFAACMPSHGMTPEPAPGPHLSGLRRSGVVLPGARRGQCPPRRLVRDRRPSGGRTRAKRLVLPASRREGRRGPHRVVVEHSGGWRRRASVPCRRGTPSMCRPRVHSGAGRRHTSPCSCRRPSAGRPTYRRAWTGACCRALWRKRHDREDGRTLSRLRRSVACRSSTWPPPGMGSRARTACGRIEGWRFCPPFRSPTRGS